MIRILIRSFLYLVFAAVLAQVLFLEAKNLPTEQLFSERGYTEILQAVMLLVGALVLAWKSRAGALSQLALCLAMGFAFLFIRENDHWLDMIFHGSWKYFGLVPLGIAGWVFWRNRDAISRQLVAWSGTASFGVMLSGFVVLAFSRLFGRTVYWETIMGDAYIRVVKNAAEEGVEFLALGLMLVGALEFRSKAKPGSE